MRRYMGEGPAGSRCGLVSLRHAVRAVVGIPKAPEGPGMIYFSAPVTTGPRGGMTTRWLADTGYRLDQLLKDHRTVMCPAMGYARQGDKKPLDLQTWMAIARQDIARCEVVEVMRVPEWWRCRYVPLDIQAAKAANVSVCYHRPDFMDVPARDDWSWEHDTCMGCGYVAGRSCGSRSMETHEIARGLARRPALTEPAAWLRLCGLCHAGVFAAMPIARQLAYKKLHDPYWYDRVAVNLLRGRQADAVTEDEVDAECETINKRRAIA